MAINNLNPRRTVWFSPHEPSNKYDIWLSKNSHYDENGESTTDSNAQRDCDYIFKIYDCGKWNPIVGFNTTAANKIDIVEGNTLYHPAVFTGENPNDLYDAGTFGSLLSDPNFVTEEEWYNVFNSSNYNWGDIFGDTNWFGDLTWSIIQGGSSDYHIPWADTDICGGIFSDIHPNSSTNRRAGIQVRFTSTDRNLYDHDYGRIPSHHLAITGDQIINTINDWYNENPGQSGININIESIIQQIIDTFDDEYPLLIGGNGILIGQDLQHTQITWKLQGLETAPDGYFPRSKTVGGNHEIEWIDLSNWLDDNFELELASTEELGGIKANTSKTDSIKRYEECVLGTNLTDPIESYQTQALFVNVDNIVGKIKTTEGITITQSDEISIDTSGANNNDVLFFNGYHVGWKDIHEPKESGFASNIGIITMSGDGQTGTEILETNHRYIIQGLLTSLTFMSYQNTNKMIVPSFFDFTTDVSTSNPKLMFDNTYEFVETYTVNSSTYNNKFSYLNGYYIVELNPETNFVVTLNGNRIYIDEVSKKDTLFNV